MTTDARILALRKIARSNGWQVGTIKPARRRAAVPLVASRIYRAAWTDGDWTGRDSWQHVEVQVDAFDNEPIARVVLGGLTIPTMSVRGVEAIEAMLLKPSPAQAVC